MGEGRRTEDPLPLSPPPIPSPNAFSRHKKKEKNFNRQFDLVARAVQYVMEKVDYVIDVQGFHDKDGFFLPKEIAVATVDCKVVRHWIIKYNENEYSVADLSHGILTTNTYLTSHHHGIEWYDGESDIGAVFKSMRDITRNALRVYVRGIQKRNLLKLLLGRHIINLEEYRCPNFENLPRENKHVCGFHAFKGEHFACALTYAYKLCFWLTKSLMPATSIPSEDTVDTKQQQQQQKKRENKRNNDKNTDDLCDSFKYLERPSSYPANNASTVVKPPRLSVRRSVINSAKQPEHVYECVSTDELSADSEGVSPRSRANGGCVSSRPNSPSMDANVCACI